MMFFVTIYVLIGAFITIIGGDELYKSYKGHGGKMSGAGFSFTCALVSPVLLAVLFGKRVIAKVRKSR